MFFGGCAGGNKPVKSDAVSSVRDEQVIEYKLDTTNTEVLDTVEIADRARKSFQHVENDAPIFSNGWVYYCWDKYADDNKPSLSIPDKYTSFCYRVKLSDNTEEGIFGSEGLTSILAVDNNWVFFNDYKQDNFLYKQHIGADERILLKKFESRYASCFGNVIVFDDRVFFTQVVDSIGGIEEGKNLIACVKTDGSENKILTKPFYRDFCIYKGMIFARNYLYELEKLDLNGNKIDNYGKIETEYYDIYDNFIYYFYDSNLCKISIDTKKKQFLYYCNEVNLNSCSCENPFISRNHLFFNTNKYRVQRNDKKQFAAFFGDLRSINLENGEMKTIYSKCSCELSCVYNGVIYGRELVKSDSIKGQGSVLKFQINMDGTGKKDLQ